MDPLEAVAVGSLVVLRSRLLDAAGFRHGFSTRRGGVSEAPFDSLNLGLAAAGEPDRRERLLENRRRFAAAIGGEALPWVATRQVHGAAVRRVSDAAAIADLPEIPAADAVASAAPGCLLSVRTADCLPILLACPRSGSAAAVHAGWRGLLAGVIAAAVEAVLESGGERGELIAAVGPAIGGERYEVGEEVAEAFEAAAVEAAFRRRGQRLHLDLFETALEQLAASGMPEGRIDGSPLCTASDEDAFFSYRRDGPRSGRLAAVIEPRGRG